ncbi:MAG TPA: hypothetical protein VLT33_29310 [Labilithrix sp.]|nr:hypothetical protein [Labilithrix sp.]
MTQRIGPQRSPVPHDSTGESTDLRPRLAGGSRVLSPATAALAVALAATSLGAVAFGCGSDSPGSDAPTPPDASSEADTSNVPDAPAPPANVHAVAGVQKATVSWDAVAGAASYDLYWSPKSGVTRSTGTKVAGLGATTFAHGPLSGGNYYYVVTATGAGGESVESAEASAAVNLVAFATSAVGSGNLGSWPDAAGKSGTAAGDTICQTLASKAKLAGSFRAWLSDDSNDAYCRVQGLTGKKAQSCGKTALPDAAGPWIRMDGAAWAGTLGSITAASYVEDVRVPLRYDENAKVRSTTYLATGTYADGTADPGNCKQWTSGANTDLVAGAGDSYVGAAWGAGSGSTCNAILGLVCLETGTGPALPPTVPVAGARKAFVTSVKGTGNLSSWADAGGMTGIAAGDAICRARATGGGLANAAKFKAWLGTKVPQAAPSARLTTNGPWARTDGIALAKDKADLADGSIATGLNVDEQGHYVPDSFQPLAWTGDSGGPALDTCVDWTSALPANQGRTGFDLDSIAPWSSAATMSCDRSFRLYCFED